MPLSPKLNDQGEPVAEDHEGIADGDRLIRRISDKQLVPSRIPGRRRVSSIAFSGKDNPTRGMSVDIEKLIVEDGKDPRRFVTTPRWFCSVYFEAGDLRTEGLKVGPLPVPGNPYHGEVWGSFNRRNKQALAKAAKWYVGADDVDIDA